MFDAIPNDVHSTLTCKMNLESHLEFLHQITSMLLLLLLLLLTFCFPFVWELFPLQEERYSHLYECQYTTQTIFRVSDCPVDNFYVTIKPFQRRGDE